MNWLIACVFGLGVSASDGFDVPFNDNGACDGVLFQAGPLEVSWFIDGYGAGIGQEINWRERPEEE